MTGAKSETDREREALENCDSEPIHLVGAIQPFAWLLAADRSVETIEHVSANIDSLIGSPPSAILGQRVDKILPAEVIHGLRNAAAHSTITKQREYVECADLNGQLVDLVAHATADHLIIEAQPAAPDHAATMAMLREAQRVFGQVSSDTALADLLDRAAQHLQAIAGHDRVMAYRFLPSGAGEVIAEACRPGIDSYFGLRFPAFDIPPQARHLFLTTPIRIIEDTTSADVPVESTSTDRGPVDLSLALCRATMPVHSMYLRNMGVRSTLTLPIVVGGELWGLFAFHNHSLLKLNTPTLMATELAGRLLSLIVEQHAQLVRSTSLEATWNLAESIVSLADTPDASRWIPLAGQLRTMASADGVAVLSGDQVVATHGSCPTGPAMRTIVAHSLTRPESPISTDNDVYCTNELTKQLPAGLNKDDLRGTAGAAVVRCSGEPSRGIVLFRTNSAANITWAGSPTKEIEDIDGQLRLNPRASFAAYVETHVERSDDWTPDDLEIFTALQRNMSQLVASQQAVRASRDRLELMVRELNHRVRNVLALIASITRRSHESSESIDLFVAQLQQRITALAIAHDLLTANEWRNISLLKLAERSVDAFGDDSRKNITIEGASELSLNSEAATILALLLHELASNAGRHGALSTPEGKVHLSWELAEREVTIKWRESNGPPVVEPTRRGFGTTIIEQAVPSELDGTSTIDYHPAGLLVTVRAPLVSLQGLDTGEEDPPLGHHRMRVVDLTIGTGIQRGTAIVVEDSFLIRDEMVTSLNRLGFDPVDSCATLDDAVELLAVRRYSFAILDVNLRGNFVGPVAEILTDQGTPFIFATGLGSRDRMLDGFNALATLTKPVTHNALVALFDRLEADTKAPAGEKG